MNKNSFIYGAQYFRPPNPVAEQHPFHIKQIAKDLGFNVVKVRLQWNTIHIAPDKLNLDEVHAILDQCEKQNIWALLEINLESAPYWLERQHPESRYVSANGRAIELGPYDSTQFGGYPGLCFHHKAIREEGERYLKMFIGALKDRKAVLCYDCWNEPHLEPAWICDYWSNMGDRLYCYCDESKAAFREWMKKKYKTIENINKVWGRMFTDWEDLKPPTRHGTYADWMDWFRFWFDSLKEHMQWRYDIIKSVDPDRIVASHSGAVPPFLARPNACIHNWKLAQPVDVWGTSFAPKFHNWTLGECAGTMDASRSAAGDKPFWISEMSGGTVYKGRGFWKSPATRPKDVRAWNWLAIAYGAKAIMYWCYLTETTGPEAGSFGLVRLNGDLTDRSLEAKKQNEIIQKYSSVIMDYMPESQVAILYDPDNSSLLFAMENGDELYSQSHIGYYKAVWKNDVFARYVTYDTIDNIKEKLLIIPMCMTITEKAAEKVRDFVANGGTVICEARTGLFDERGYLQPDIPSRNLTEVAGLVEEEAFCSDPGNYPELNNPEHLPWPDGLYNDVEITLTRPINTTLHAHGYLVPLKLQGAEAIGTSNGFCAAAYHKYGKGEVYYFGTYMGLAMFNGDKGAEDTIMALVKQYTTPEVCGEKLRPRLIRGKDESLLLIFNNDKYQKETDTIKIPEEFSSASDVQTAEEVKIKGNSITVTVDAEDVKIIRLC